MKTYPYLYQVYLGSPDAPYRIYYIYLSVKDSDWHVAHEVFDEYIKVATLHSF